MFRVVANRVSIFMGSAYAFASAVLLIVVWLITGPLFQYSDTWQLIINTSTTIITFLMVFLIQNTQNRDTRTLHLKIDELLRAIESARTGLVDLDDLPEEELEKIQEQFRGLAAECKKDDLMDVIQNTKDEKQTSPAKN
ncbi:low affinity iron permease family protein [bacterium]|nr:low affinity iron permease family protein [bacterium]